MSDPEAREAYLRQVCGDDVALYDRVDALLRVTEQEASFLEVSPYEATVDVPAPVESPGTVIGPYRLLEAIGEGGMGVVYVAEQHEPVRRRVALKVIRPGMDSKQVVARFEAERQALAVMDHPNIAKVHDAGMTPAGRPYFVMELVRGQPITEYCDREELSIPERLELFVLVCRAVQHAHQKGVIHRDLKPSNVLVTVVDGVPTPKVIDFGVAKATGQALTDKTVYTGFHQFVGTPLYTSPEQADLAGTDVDTRSDVYSLGVLLYELLTGTTPFDSETLKRAAFDEMRRIIREEEPPRPSTRLSSLGERLSTVSARRKADPRRLGSSVKGELDWVVMKALEKDRRRRYETANDFAADVMRFLTDRPVEAFPPSPWYRFGKFAKRNRIAIGLATFVAAVLIAGVFGLSAGLVAIAREQARGKERLALARRAVDEMYTEVAEEWLADRGHMTPLQRQFLEKALAFYTRFAAEGGADPEDRHKAARALVRVAEIRLSLGQATAALTSSEQAAERLSALAEEHPGRAEYRASLAKSLGSMAESQRELGRLAESDRSLRKAIEVQEGASKAAAGRVATGEKNLLFWLHHELSGVLESLGRTESAEGAAKRAFEVAEQRLKGASDDPMAQLEMAGALITLADFHRMRGRPAEAEEALRRSVGIGEPLAAKDPSKAEYRVVLANGWNDLGTLLMDLGIRRRDPKRVEQAEAAFRKADDILARLADAFPQVVRYRVMRATALNNFGFALANAHRPDEALETYRRGLAIAEKLAADYPEVPEHRHDVGMFLSNMASALGSRGEWTRSLEVLDRAVSLQRDVLKASAANSGYGGRLLDLLRQRAEAHIRLGDHAAASADAGEMWQAAREVWGEPVQYQQYRWGKLTFQAYLTYRDCVPLARGDSRLQPGQRDEVAEDYLAKARSMLDEAEERGRDDALVLDQLIDELANGSMPEFRDPKRALRAAERKVELYPRSAVAWKQLAMARYRAGAWDDAIRAAEKDLELRGGQGYAYQHTILAAAYARKGELDKAREWFAKAKDAADSNGLADTPRSVFDEAASLLGAAEATGARAERPDGGDHSN